MNMTKITDKLKEKVVEAKDKLVETKDKVTDTSKDTIRDTSGAGTKSRPRMILRENMKLESQCLLRKYKSMSPLL